MKYLNFYFLFIFIWDFSLFGQDPGFPIIEQGYVLYDDYINGTISNAYYRYQYTYTENGLLTNFRSLDYDWESTQWKVKFNLKNHYNQNDQIVRQEIDHFQFRTFEIDLHQDVILEYQNGQLDKKIYNIIHHYDNSRSKVTEYYDRHARNYKTIREELDWTGQPTLSTTTSEWDENGCWVFHSYKKDRINPANNQAETIDEYFWESNYIGDCLPTGYTSFRINPVSQKLEIDERSRTVYTFDSLGNMILQKYYTNQEEWDTTLTLIEEISNSYDAQGKIISSITNYEDLYNKTRRNEDFDLNGNLVKELGEIYDFGSEKWNPSYLIISNFNSKNNIVKWELFSEFSALINNYLISRQSDYIYNADNQLSSIYSISIDESGQNVLTEEYRSEYHYDCEGRFKEVITQDLIENKVTSRRYQIYLDKPPCELSQSAEISFSLFPNPAKEYVHISLNVEVDKPVILITDVNGRNISPNYSSYNNIHSLDISGLSPGIYLISVLTEAEIFSSKLIKI